MPILWLLLKSLTESILALRLTAATEVKVRIGLVNKTSLARSFELAHMDNTSV